MLAPAHIPVLIEEATRALAVQPGGRYIDCTLGAGGHAAAILEKSSPGGQLLGIDADIDAIKAARRNLSDYGDSILLVNDNFVNLKAICYKYDFVPVHGIILDLGLSSLQLESDSRGFSFQRNAPLDMRLNPNQELTAAYIINNHSESELANLIRKYGEEARSRQIAKRIIKERPIKSTLELAKTIEKVTGPKRTKIHPATKTFQALRIAVNKELENLSSTLNQAVDLLGYEGRLVVISYHSLEDRIVKQFIKRESQDCICPPDLPACVCDHTASLKPVNKRVITPSLSEVQSNPRSRSARLRAAERIIAREEHFNVVERLCSNAQIRSNGNGWRKPSQLRRLRQVFSIA